MRVNKEIRAPRLRVIGKDGQQVGILTQRDALQLAEKEELDLVEISPQADPPVCKIIDYGKFRFEQAKKEKESKKASHQVKVKEIKIKPNIDVHDLNTKLKHAKEFLLKQNKVRVTCSFRGREMLHMELGHGVVRKFCEQLGDVSQVESPLKREGRRISLVLAPLSGKKAKVQKEDKSMKKES